MTTKPLTGYAKSISAAIGSIDPAVLDEVEDMMRMNLSGLDHLPKRAFNRLARESAGTCAAMGAIAAAEYARDLAA